MVAFVGDGLVVAMATFDAVINAPVLGAAPCGTKFPDGPRTVCFCDWSKTFVAVVAIQILVLFGSVPETWNTQFICMFRRIASYRANRSISATCVAALFS